MFGKRVGNVEDFININMCSVKTGHFEAERVHERVIANHLLTYERAKGA